MHGFGGIRIHRTHQVLIDALRHERREGRDEAAEGRQHLGQRHKGRFLVPRHTLAPEAAAAAADIPVAQVIHQVLDCAGALGDAQLTEALVHLLHGAVEAAEDPLVHQAQLDLVQVMLKRVELVDIRVENIESIGIPQRGHELALAFADRFLGEAAGQPGGAGGIEVPAHGIGALLVKDRPGIDHVAQMLGHLSAVLVLHMPQNQAAFIGRALKHRRTDRQQAVEPAAGLVDGLADELRREGGLELFLVFKGIMPLGEGHGTRIVPAVDHLFFTAHIAAALGAAQHNAVDIRPVQLRQVDGTDAHRLELLHAADHMGVALLAGPHGQGRAPVALAGNSPVDHVFNEVAHAAFLDVIGMPVHRAVVFDKLVSNFGHADEPARAGVVKQGGVTAPAVRVVMGVHLLFKQQAAGREILHDQRIGILHKLASPGGPLHKFAFDIYRLQEGQAVDAADARVVFAEGRGVMHDARAVSQGDIVVGDNIPALFQGLLLRRIQRLVLDAREFPALDGLDAGDRGRVLSAEHAFHQRLGHHEGLSAQAEPEVILFLVDAQSHVAGQRPGRGRPGQEIGIILTLHFEAHVCRVLADLLVALRHLMAGQRRAAAGAVGDHLVPAVQEALVGDLPEAPPHGFYIVVMVGDIGILHVQPVGHLLGHVLPLAQILPNALFAGLNKGLHAIGLYPLLAFQAQALFNLQLNRQAMGIPAGHAQHILALHGVEARDQVLHGPGQDVADMRLAVGCGRPVIKGKALLALMLGEALLDDAFFLPESGHFLFAAQKIHVRRYFLIHTALQHTP